MLEVALKSCGRIVDQRGNGDRTKIPYNTGERESHSPLPVSQFGSRCSQPQGGASLGVPQSRGSGGSHPANQLLPRPPPSPLHLRSAVTLHPGTMKFSSSHSAPSVCLINGTLIKLRTN